MSDAELVLVGGGISLVTTIVTVVGGELLRAWTSREHDRERFERERAERREQYDRERAERLESRWKDRRQHTLEGLQQELAIIRRWLIWYRNTSASLGSTDSDMPHSDAQWQDYQQTLSDADDALMTLASRVDDELRQLLGDMSRYQQIWSTPPAPDRADLAQDALLKLRKVRLRSGKLLQDLWQDQEARSSPTPPPQSSAPTRRF